MLPVGQSFLGGTSEEMMTFKKGSEGDHREEGSGLPTQTSTIGLLA